MNRYADGKLPMVLAHRGGGDEGPEHSLEAYQHAVATGCEHLELDVWLGQDGGLVLTHGRPVSGKSYITLDDVFDAFPSQCFAIDPKHRAAVLPLATLIAQRGMAKAVCLGASTDTRARQTADEVERLCGVRPAMALVSALSSLDAILSPERLAARRKAFGAAFLHMHKSLITPRVVRHAHISGLRLIAWTVNDSAGMNRLLDWGVDGFMTDAPALAQAALQRRRVQ